MLVIRSVHLDLLAPPVRLYVASTGGTATEAEEFIESGEPGEPCFVSQASVCRIRQR